MQRLGTLIPVTVEKQEGFDLWIPGLSLDVFDLELGKPPRLISYDGVKVKPGVLTEAMVFRIPQLNTKQFLCTGYSEDSNDFYSLYRKMELTGLQFKFVCEYE